MTRGLLSVIQNRHVYVSLTHNSGRYTEETGSVILYVIRLLVRVEGFMLYIINHHRWDKTSVNGSRWEAFVRGLDSTDVQVKLMADKRRELHEMLHEQVRLRFLRALYTVHA